MTSYHWQKSSYSGNAANCLYLAVDDDGTARLRESDAPDVIISTSAERLSALLLNIKQGRFSGSARG